MTVRVNKSSFNIREKLSELERPIGLKGSELMRAETAQEARDLVSAGRKNLIINGAMQINQRGTVTNLGSSLETNHLDRWKHYNSNSGPSRFTASRSTDAPPGFLYSCKLDCTTADTSIAAADSVRLAYRGEATDFAGLGEGTSEAKSATLSFWVKSNKTGTYCVDWYNYSSTPTCSKQYTINSANTWEYKTITFPPCPNTAGTTQQSFWFWLMAGSYNTVDRGDQWTSSTDGRAYGQTVNLADSTDNEWFITGIQLEVGKNATEFEHRSYGEELALCQRYYQLIRSGSMLPATTNGTSQVVNIGIPLAVSMRTTPTVDNSQQFVVWHASANGSAASNQTMLINGGDNLVGIRGVLNGFSGLTDNRVANVVANNSNIQLNAEL